jgi:hypothetical protein
VEDSGDAVEAVFKGLIERGELGRRNAGRLGIDVDDVAVLRVEFEVGALEFVEALREEACPNEEDEGERGLEDDEGALQEEALEEVERAPVRRASAGWVWAAIHAGATPKRTPVMRQRAQAKARTGREGEASMGTF